MTKMENDIVIPSKPIFHGRFVDDIYSTEKIVDNLFFQQVKRIIQTLNLGDIYSRRKIGDNVCSTG